MTSCTTKTNNKSTSTFSNQSSLPRLPIPPLEDTLKRFSKAVAPLLPSKSQQESTQKIIHDFLETDGPKLQSLLLKYDHEQKHGVGSYIEEFWSDAYLAPDTSVVLNLNPFFLLEDGLDTKESKSQVLRAASLTFNCLKFAASLKNETMKPDSFKGVTLCMDQFHALFGSARLPKVTGKDVVEIDTESGHVVVLFRNQFYYFQGLWNSADDVTTSHHHHHEDIEVAVSQGDIADILDKIVQDGKKISLEEGVKDAIGVLTTLPRKKWANTRELLLKISDHNQNALEIIDSALFVLVLDDYVPSNTHEAAANMLHGTHLLQPSSSTTNISNTTTQEKDNHLDQYYQAGTCCNRWYDKLQLIVCTDGSAGINFEHSAIDGHTALRLASDVFAETVVAFAKSITKSVYIGSCPLPSIIDAKVRRAVDVIDRTTGKPLLDTNPKKLTFVISEQLRQKIFHAETALSDAVSENDTYALEFNQFGKDLIVGNKMSPDSVVQMSMLIAYYKLYGEIVCAYEPVLTKRFFHGRTEAMRSTTSDAAELCKIWSSPLSTNNEKLQALRKATSVHSSLVKEASEGNGVDRHLYALQCIAEKHNLPTPEFFKSQPWKVLNHTIISTSNCGNPALRLFGFGPVTPDGFGIGYIIKDDGLQYTISSKHRQTRRYANTIREVLHEIGSMLKPLHSNSLEIHRGSNPAMRHGHSPSRTRNSELSDAILTSSSRPKLGDKSGSFVGRALKRMSCLDASTLQAVGHGIGIDIIDEKDGDGK